MAIWSSLYPNSHYIISTSNLACYKAGINFAVSLVTDCKGSKRGSDISAVTGGYIEINVSLPGANDISGLWPGGTFHLPTQHSCQCKTLNAIVLPAWTMGNLGRAGYGATTDGTWPYTYDSCDTGTLPNQTYVNGTGPADALSGGDKDHGGALSYQPGQRLSACTCSGEDHPGPNTATGRGTPEIDIFEAQISWNPKARHLQGAVSQSAQVAPCKCSLGPLSSDLVD